MFTKFFSKPAIAVSFIFCVAAANAQGITTPRTPSPAAMVQQTVGISTITVKYSRPSVKGREIWGKLVPYGWNVQQFGLGNSAPWRAGANENTTIQFSHDAEVEGQSVPAGTYGLTFVINQDNTGEVILSKDYRSWGSFFYDPAHDQMRAKIQLHSNSFTEMLTYDFMNDTKTSTELVLNWELKQFPVKIEFDVDNIVMANAKEELKSTTGFSFLGFQTAAQYALANKVNLPDALNWINIANAQNPGLPGVVTKSDILRAMGNNADADKTLNAGLAVATENELNLYGYQLMNQGNVDKAIEILKLNTEHHPESANVWDSLGEAYATKGDKANAIINFKKSLSLNPPANVKANSEKFLKQLGAQ